MENSEGVPDVVEGDVVVAREHIGRERHHRLFADVAGLVEPALAEDHDDASEHLWARALQLRIAAANLRHAWFAVMCEV